MRLSPDIYYSPFPPLFLFLLQSLLRPSVHHRQKKNPCLDLLLPTFIQAVCLSPYSPYANGSPSPSVSDCGWKPGRVPKRTDCRRAGAHLDRPPIDRPDGPDGRPRPGMWERCIFLMGKGIPGFLKGKGEKDQWPSTVAACRVMYTDYIYIRSHRYERSVLTKWEFFSFKFFFHFKGGRGAFFPVSINPRLWQRDPRAGFPPSLPLSSFPLNPI